MKSKWGFHLIYFTREQLSTKTWIWLINVSHITRFSHEILIQISLKSKPVVLIILSFKDLQLRNLLTVYPTNNRTAHTKRINLANQCGGVSMINPLSLYNILEAYKNPQQHNMRWNWSFACNWSAQTLNDSCSGSTTGTLGGSEAVQGSSRDCFFQKWRATAQAQLCPRLSHDRLLPNHGKSWENTSHGTRKWIKVSDTNTHLWY